MEIRPRPEQCAAWAEAAGFRLLPPGVVDLPPYHYGLALERPKAGALPSRQAGGRPGGRPPEGS